MAVYLLIISYFITFCPKKHSGALLNAGNEILYIIKVMNDQLFGATHEF